MVQRIFTIHKCPLCGDYVEEVSIAKLLKEPHYHDVEMIVTRRGLRQYIHSSCWYKMIEEKRPYDGRLYM